MRRLWLAWLLLGACASAGADAPRVVAPPGVDEAKLAPGDVVEIRVYREPDLAGVYRVSSQGEIDFPLIRKVRLLGLDTEQVADQIRSRLADGFLQDPQVTVFVRERNSQKVHVLGFVTKPGSFNFEVILC